MTEKEKKKEIQNQIRLIKMQIEQKEQQILILSIELHNLNKQIKDGI